MFQLLAAVTAAVQLSNVGEVHVADLPGVFAAACLDGEAKLSVGEATKVSFDELPSAIKRQLGRPSSGDVWRLATGGRSYLYILNYPNHLGISPRICGVASDDMSLKSGVDMLDVRLAGDGRLHNSRSMQWLRPEDGYVATATTASGINVLQVNWLSDADRELQKNQLRPISR